MIKFFFGIVFVGLVGFSVKKPADNKSLANVNQQQGILIFTDCKPVAEYEFVKNINAEGQTLGTVINGGPGQICFCSYTYTQAVEATLKMISKKKLQADGIIFNTSNMSADLIKFK